MNSRAYRATWERCYRGDLTGPPLFVALVMAELAEPGTGAVTVGLRTLAEMTGYAKGTVTDAIGVAGLYEMDGRGIGRRPSTYVLASSQRDASPVDNGSLPRGSVLPEGRNSVQPSGRSVQLASKIGPLASSQEDTQLEPKTLKPKPRFSVQHPDDVDGLTPACELPGRVASLRESMRAHPSGDGAA